MNCQGNLERTWKVREQSGNLKINGYGSQSSENLFTCILFKRGKDICILMRQSKPIPLLIGGYSQRKEFAPLGSKFFLRVAPKFEVTQLTPLK